MDTPPPPPDADAWEKAAEEFYIGSLEKIRGSAEKWCGTVATLLGLFGTVAIVSGPTEIAKIPEAWLRTTVIGLIVLAGVAAGTAVVVGAFAAQGIPKERARWDGETYRAYVVGNSSTARTQLLVSRAAGIAAACIVFAGGVLLLIGANGAVGAKTPSAEVVVVTRGGGVECGELGRTSGEVTVNGAVVRSAIRVVPVTKC